MESLGTSPGALPSRGPWFSSLYVISIDTGGIAQSPQSSPRWSPAFKTEPVLSVSSFNTRQRNRRKRNKCNLCAWKSQRNRYHFSLSCIEEGNGNPLQCSCLENPRGWEPGGLLSTGSYRVGHDWSDLAVAAAAVAKASSFLHKETVLLWEINAKTQFRVLSW